MRVPTKLRRAMATATLGTLGGAVLLFLDVPVLSVISISFSSSMVFKLIPRDRWFSQYRNFVSCPEWRAALGPRSRLLGTTVVATTMGTLALGLRRLAVRGALCSRR
jgi:ABC-type spermidine/putrescine transport system permease subunit II